MTTLRKDDEDVMKEEPQMHMQELIERKLRYKCGCGKICKSERGLHQHETVCNGNLLDNQFQCEICWKICKSASGLSLHKNRGTCWTMIHGLHEKHVCDKCSKIYKSKSDLETHQEICGTKDEIKCNVCLKVFKSIGGLSNHMSRHHRGNFDDAQTEDNLKCHVCLRVFKTPGGCSNHQKTCGVQIQHPCDQCDKVLKSAQGLALHKKTCGLPKIQCDYCKKTFANASRVRLHMVKCDGNALKDDCPTEFTCETCAKVYKTKKGIDNHVCKPRIKVIKKTKSPSEKKEVIISEDSEQDKSPTTSK